MDAILVTLAVLSLSAALVLGVVAWRFADDQRRRSAARVAALATAIDGSTETPAAPAMSEPAAVSSMFQTVPGAAVAGTPLLKAVVASALAVALMLAAAIAARGPAAAAEAVLAAPLELVSMRHERNGDTLRVTGLVRNPRAGEAVTGVTAVLFAFDRDGNFVTSSQAPLDFTTLAPGDESPFVVNLEKADDVGRYRVSLRTGAGVLRHVDRRAAGRPANAAAALN
jgi:hypothetical protein